MNDTEIIDYMAESAGLLHCVWDVTDKQWRIYRSDRPLLEVFNADLRAGVCEYAKRAAKPERPSLL